MGVLKHVQALLSLTNARPQPRVPLPELQGTLPRRPPGGREARRAGLARSAWGRDPPRPTALGLRPPLAARLQAPIDRRGSSQRHSRIQALLRGNLQGKPKVVGRQQQGRKSSAETRYSSSPACQTDVTAHTQACCARPSRPRQHAWLSTESCKTGRNKDHR